MKQMGEINPGCLFLALLFYSYAFEYVKNKYRVRGLLKLPLGQ